MTEENSLSQELFPEYLRLPIMKQITSICVFANMTKFVIQPYSQIFFHQVTWISATPSSNWSQDLRMQEPISMFEQIYSPKNF
jgi:hypothetical protein